jgi:hypothetical protein
MKNIDEKDVEILRKVLDRLKKFRDVWSTREDDPEDMLMEAPEMATNLVSEMEPVMKRLDDVGERAP